jgi:hypothetical protein
MSNVTPIRPSDEERLAVVDFVLALIQADVLACKVAGRGVCVEAVVAHIQSSLTPRQYKQVYLDFKVGHELMLSRPDHVYEDDDDDVEVSA